MTTAASTTLPNSPSRGEFDFGALMHRLEHPEEDKEEADPLTEENVCYELGQAFLRLYSADQTLQCVDLDSITEENAISILSVIPKSNSLQELCLTYSHLTVNIVPCVNLGANLRILDLGGNQLGDDGVEALAETAWSKNLKFLNLSDNNLGDIGVCAIADVGESLQSLCICENPGIGNFGAEALVQLSASLDSIFCWDNEYSYKSKDILESANHPKLFWVRPYHWESELQKARDRALKPQQKDDESTTASSIDRNHLVSNLLQSTSEVFQAARKHLLENYDPTKLNPEFYKARIAQLQKEKKPSKPQSISPTTVIKQTVSLDESETSTTSADIKARLRERRERLAKAKEATDHSYCSAQGQAVDTSEDKSKMEYGHSCRRWKSSSEAQEKLPQYAKTKAENRRRNQKRRSILHKKLATVDSTSQSQFSVAKAKLQILERHQELAHQFI